MQSEQQAAAITRAGVVVVGLAAVVYGVYLLQNLLGQLAEMFGRIMDYKVGWDDWLVLGGALLGPIVLLGTGLILLKNSESISRKYFSTPVIEAEVVIYRAAFAIIGLFFVTMAFTRLLTLVSNLATKFFREFPDEFEMGLPYFLPWIVSAVVNLCLGLYLFLGAPGLLGWHLRKCKEVDREDDTP